jgi:hypothetical protein
VSNRVSQIVLLCEDDEHRRLAVTYMNRCGINTSRVVVERVASRLQQGGNVGWVLDEFPRQMHACRQRHKAKANTLLIVMVDADMLEVAARRHQLNERLALAGYDGLSVNDPVALLIPRRHVETWIRALLGEGVTEEDDCKAKNRPTRDEVRQAADTAYQWSRPNANAGPTCVPSLALALPEWRKIG